MSIKTRRLDGGDVKSLRNWIGTYVTERSTGELYLVQEACWDGEAITLYLINLRTGEWKQKVRPVDVTWLRNTEITIKTNGEGKVNE